MEILNILNKAAALQNKLIKKIAGKLLTSCYLLVNKSNNTVEYISTSEQDLNTHAGDNDLNPEDYPPYLSGYMLYDTNKKNVYNILASKYNQIVVAGPSGSTDLFLIISKMFKPFDLNLGILACIAWMCNIPQHSIFEVLMGSLPFGLVDWNPTINAHEYIEKLNEKLKDSQKAEELTQSILQNKQFIVEDKIKAVIKKK